MNPIILGLETSTDACSVALLAAEQKIYHEFTVEPQAHSKLLLGMVDAVCMQAGITLDQVTAFAFGSGPGSFTGLRIAASAVQGLAFGVGKPVIAVSSLQALAQQACAQDPASTILAMLDARMHEVYWGVYKNVAGLAQVESADRLQKPAELLFDTAVNYVAVGTGCTAYHDLLLANNPQLIINRNILYPRAQEVVQLAADYYQRGEVLTAAEAIPVYLRNDVVQTGKKNPG